MTSPRTVIFNTLEQILSTDMNRVGTLAGKAAMDTLLWISTGFSGATPKNATVQGLDLTAAAALTVDLSPGELLLYDGAASGDDSKMRLGRLDATENINLGPAAAANPRVDLIYATPTVVTSDSSIRNVLTLPARTVTPTLIDKTSDSGLSITVATGGESALPTPPVAPAGAIPLWYVFVGVGVGGFTDAEFIDARDKLQPESLAIQNERQHGCYIARDPLSTTSAILENGVVTVGGRSVKVSSQQSFTGVGMSADGSTALTASTDYDIYMIAGGSLSPMGKNTNDGFVLRIESGNAPQDSGFPIGSITYRPLPGVHDEVRFTTTQALYLGSLRTNPGGGFETGGSGQPISRDGVSRDVTVEPGQIGVATLPHCWLRPPVVRYVSSEAISVGASQFLMSGIPGRIGTTTVVDITTDLHNLEVEQNSTWYYIYMRNLVAKSALSRTLVHSYVFELSSEKPDSFGRKPTPQVGFASDDYLYCGVVYNNSAGDFYPFRKNGHIYLLEGTSLAAPWVDFYMGATPATGDTIPNNPGVLVQTMNLPGTARNGIVDIEIERSGTTSSVAGVNIFNNNTGAVPKLTRLEWGGTNNFAPDAKTVQLFMKGTSARQIGLRQDGMVDLTAHVSLSGFVEDVNSPDQ